MSLKKILFFGIIVMLPIVACSKQLANFTILPVRFVNHLPVTPITIDHKKILALIDTGTTYADLAIEKNTLLTLSSIIYQSKSITYSNSFGQKTKNQLFIVPKIQLNNLTLENLPGISFTKMLGCTDSKSSNLFKPVKAILGINLLKKFNLILDFAHKKLYIFPRNSPIRKNLQWIPFRLNKEGLIIIDSKINNQKARVMFDTRNTDSFIASTALLKNCRQCHSIKSTNYKKLKINHVNFRGIIMNHIDFLIIPSLKLSNLPFDISLGEDFIKKYKVFIDFSNHRIAFEKEVKNDVSLGKFFGY